MKNTILNESISLDAPIILGDDGNLQTLADFIPDRENPFSEPRETQIIDGILLKEELDEASNILKKKLTPLETEIFEEYGYDSTYKEISKNLNVPAKCVDNALTRIRKKATDVYTIYKDANHKFEGSLYREEIIVIEEYIQSKDKKNE
jgi:DNA-directed RNA polymerase specialized sigma24 family protein